ncbi:Coiled-coil domain-containing protein 125 [Liparis tanakae]|uniref:Coiled-coil domain-containing protein 125 n=1 Tax=Liparis tanakae TaxID=230148 RepID=A0A4Z2ETJ7_9TELE|nr:Coiled-coil domain-containing protein 125 [Liparis tanakae]
MQEAGEACSRDDDMADGDLGDGMRVIDVLCCELEVAHRYVEGKYEALKILQGKAILDQATSHTKSLLQKTEAEATALEKVRRGCSTRRGLFALTLGSSDREELFPVCQQQQQHETRVAWW